MRSKIGLRAFENYKNITHEPIPTRYFNKYYDQMRDLKVCDFYWASSRKSYLPQGQSYDVCSYDAIMLNLKAGARLINLDVYNDNNNPVIRNKTSMPLYGNNLDFNKCLQIIKTYGWRNASNYPLILYLEIHTDSRIVLYKIYQALKQNFPDKFLNKKYSYSGKNNQFPLGQIPIKETLGKLIIITDKYPLIGNLNELVNGTTQSGQEYIIVKDYSAGNERFGGLASKSSDMQSLINYNKFNLTIIDPQGEDTMRNIYNPKVDLFNAPFEDCAKFGCQLVMINYQLFDDKMKKYYETFKNKGLILKPPELRYIDKPPTKINKQNKKATFAPSIFQQEGWFSVKI